MKRDIAVVRCGLVRACSNRRCVLNLMANMGYKSMPSNELDKKKNFLLERQFGKGYYPSFTTIGRGDSVGVICNDFRDKDKS
jgi:hypothetical protein